MSEKMTEDRIHTVMIEVFTDEEVVRGLVSNPSLIITENMWSELLGSQICDNIYVLRII